VGVSARGRPVVAPILPARDFDETIRFYAGFGFSVAARHEAYLILRRDLVELHFFAWPDIEPEASYAGCYIRVPDVDAYFQALSPPDLPNQGIPRLVPVEDKPWGMREFALIDCNGSLIRVGSPI
jgi:catechol 2,3-dioxygenase-like lactoylglutathione lyase family enzyme